MTRRRSLTRRLRPLAIFLLAGAAAGQDVSTWVRVSPPGARFSVRLPGTPAERYEEQTATHNMEIRSGDQRYTVSWSDLSKEARRSKPEQVLEHARDEFLKVLPNAKLISSGPAKVGGAAGLAWVLETAPPNRAPLRMKGVAVVSKGRLFTAAFMTSLYQFDEEAVDRFLTTFRLLDLAGGAGE